MILSECLGRSVVVETIDKEIFRGKVVEYFPSDENENNEESIVIRNKTNNVLVELYLAEIKTVDPLPRM